MTKVLAIDLGSSSARVMLIDDEKEQRALELARFSHTAIDGKHGVRWQTEGLFADIITAIDKALWEYDVKGIGICSWGVDYAVVKADGSILDEPYSYRDPRGERAYECLHKKDKLLDERAMYELSGIFPNPINTVYQLYDDKLCGRIDSGAKIIMIADLLAYRLTGRVAVERTNASTTGLLSTDGVDWNYPLIAWLGINKEIFPQLISAGEVYGYYRDVPVFAVCTHDTASAIVAMGASDPDTAFLSSGSWMLVGRLQDDVIVTDDAFKAKYTNERGYGDKVTFLNNINGLFIIQSLQRELGVSYSDIDAKMDAAKVLGVVDVNLLMSEGEVSSGMLSQLQLKSADPFDLIKTAYFSLANNISLALKQLVAVTARPLSRLLMTGGATKAPYFMAELRQQTGLKTVAVTGEGAVLGNAIVQLNSIKNGY